MALSLEDMISEIRQFKTSLLDVELFSLVQRGEIQVQNALSSAPRDKFAHLYQNEVTKSVRHDSPVIVLPDDAGKVLRIELDGKAIPLLDMSQAQAATTNYLYSNSAVRRGSELQIYGLSAPSMSKRNVGSAARIVYETSFEKGIFIDGFYAKTSDFPYTDNGIPLLVLDVMFPTQQQFEDGALKGATLRFYDNSHQARDYTVFTNFWGDPNGNEIAEKHAQRIVLNSAVSVVRINYPNFTKYGEFGYPIRITRIALPPLLREAIVLWAKYEVTDDFRFRQDYFNFMAQFGVRN